MPEPRSGESKKDFLKRCIPYIVNYEGGSVDHAVAKCNGIYDQSKKNKRLIDNVKNKGSND